MPDGIPPALNEAWENQEAAPLVVTDTMKISDEELVKRVDQQSSQPKEASLSTEQWDVGVIDEESMSDAKGVGETKFTVENITERNIEGNDTIEQPIIQGANLSDASLSSSSSSDEDDSESSEDEMSRRGKNYNIIKQSTTDITAPVTTEDGTSSKSSISSIGSKCSSNSGSSSSDDDSVILFSQSSTIAQTIEEKKEVLIINPPLTAVEADDRPPMVLFGDCGQSRWINDSDIEDMRRLFELKQNILFKDLVGGKVKGRRSLRQYTPELVKHKDVHRLVERCIDPYIKWLQKLYPELSSGKLTVLRSLPGAKSQYDGCNMRLHSDFGKMVNAHPPQQRPLSLMVAIDPFEFMYLPDRSACKKDLITQTVHPRQAIAFTNYCLHAGGANNTGKYCYRLFAYMVSNTGDLPGGMIYYYPWDATGKTIVDVDGRESEEECERVKVKRSKGGRMIVATNRFGFETSRK
jgi:hypothetical protein